VPLLTLYFSLGLMYLHALQALRFGIMFAAGNQEAKAQTGVRDCDGRGAFRPFCVGQRPSWYLPKAGV